MRHAFVHPIRAAALLAAIAPMAATANEGETTLAASGATATTPFKAAAPQVVAMTPATWSPDGGLLRASMTVAEPAARSSAPYRLAPSRDADPYGSVRSRLHYRGTGMIDSYVNGSSGMRVSAGANNHMHYHAADDGPGAAAGSGATMRLPRGAVNLRDGYEYHAPIALVGYDVPVSERLKVGVEGGMMKGRAAAIFATDYLPGGAGESHTASNPVGDVVMTLVF